MQMDIVDRIFELVDKQYPEQRDFASRIGVVPSVVSAWRGRKSASYNKRLPEIADILGTTPEYLLTGQESAPAAGDPEVAQALEVFGDLTPEERAKVFGFMEGLKAQRK